MRSLRRQAQSCVVRIVLTAAVGIVLLIYGWTQLHAAASFIGAMVTLYVLYGVWFKWALYEEPVRVYTKINEEINGAFQSQLEWCTTLSSGTRLPWLYIRVEEIWELVSDELGATESDPNRFTQAVKEMYDPYHAGTDQAGVMNRMPACSTGAYSANKMYWSSTKLIHPNGRKSFAYSQLLPKMPRGIYRYVSTELYTGDIWGWFTKKMNSHHVRLPASDVLIMPSAGKWKESNTNLPLSFMQTDGAQEKHDTAVSYCRGGVPTPELRSYQPGDPWRSIHWRSYAKHRQLTVKVSREADKRQLTIVLDESWLEASIRHEADQQKLLEEALDAAAEWCSIGWKQGILVRLIWLNQGEMQVGMEAISRAIALASLPLISSNDICMDKDSEYVSSFEDAVCRSSSNKVLHQQVQGCDIVVISHLEVSEGAPRIQTQLRGCRIAVWVTLTDDADAKQVRSRAAEEPSSLPTRKEEPDYAASSH
ncbi:DUF58 domain-containing protein [Paenibacillus sp. UMB4589-SE434]|uniref:DUF58 domain-containing protein n=1 Tax=Paenibacillus sp. UMB4589-SE434 TaxID=3046314 RepID=UPI00254D896B|nr:DUF58 domain-containing protein [Paenibacillus sp. UMB4589-SE434]MDK8182671.1 DUF58 domain-containing protein [Paenibacillus sp. UMB4589-SE434]